MTEQEFLDKHSALVYNLALRLTGNRSDAEDLAQDALLKALKSLSSFRGESQASTWVYRITVNAWKNRVRSEKRRAFWKTISFGMLGGDEDEDGPAYEPAGNDPPLDASLASDEKSAEVQKALLQLDDEERAIVVLREIEERSYEEIGKVLELPAGTVKSRLFRARAKLRTILEKRSVTP